MYNISILPHNTKTLDGEDPIDIDSETSSNLIICKAVFPLHLVNEFDIWLNTKLKPEHLSRPTSAILDYSDPSGNWVDMDDISVVYYLAVMPEKLEMIEHFSSTYQDLRK